MRLKLKNPIIFFDLETTGINIASDRIVEISYLKVDLNGNESSRTYRVNPEMPIPEKSSAIHGILDEDVKDAPTFKDVAKIVAKEFEGCDLAGYNSVRFDIPLLAEEFLRVGVEIDLKRRKFVDVQVIFMKMEQRTLSAAYKFFVDKEESVQELHLFRVIHLVKFFGVRQSICQMLANPNNRFLINPMNIKWNAIGFANF